MKKTFFCILLIYLLYSTNSTAQVLGVGINTDSPSAALDINGDTFLQGELFLGGDDDTKGESGKKGQIIMSRGEAKSPVWENIIYLPEYGNYQLITNDIRSDYKGVIFPYNTKTSSTIKYSKDMILSAEDFSSKRWQAFEDLTVDLPPLEDVLRITVTFEVIATSSYIGTNGNEGWSSFAIAVCVDDPTSADQMILKAVKGSVCRGLNNAQTTFYMHTVLDDLPPNYHNKLYIVASQRQTNGDHDNESAEMVIGRDLNNATVDQSFLKGATASINIYKKIRE